MNSKLIRASIVGAIAAGAVTAADAQQQPVDIGKTEYLRSCAVCHGIRNSGESRNRAPTFSAIANVKGMSAMVLNVALLSSHRSMPNIVLDAQERADVIAFILTLKTK